MKTIATAVISILLAAPALRAAGCPSAAKTLAKAAGRAGVERVAVLPFSPLDDSSPAEGRIIAERLTNCIAAGRRVAVVERTRLAGVMSEHRLGLSGALNSRKLARIGALLQARAVVVGSFIALGNKVELHARLVDIETGEVLAARSAEAERDWFAYSNEVIPAPAPFGLEEAVSDVLFFQRGERLPAPVRAAPRRETLFSARGEELRDSPAETQSIEELQASVVELKARHWALQIRKKKLDFADTLNRTAAGMSPALRERYAGLLREAWIWGAARLTQTEIKRFIAADAAAFALRARGDYGVALP